MRTIEDNTPWFRELFENVLGYRGDSLYESELKPWIDNARIAMAHAARFKTAERCDTKTNDFLLPNWNLYALSRVNDHLLRSFQSDERGSWAGPQISQDEYSAFFTEIGFTAFQSGLFSSFHNEIVTVEQSLDRDEPITIQSTLWPGLKFGDMIFSRAGTGVRGGTANVVKQIAESSTLYFTHRRLHRKTSDLSLGWGSNSQWRTGFRRDYELNDKLIYNIDGSNSLNSIDQDETDRDDLTASERLELCKNRCLIAAVKDDADLWPYDDSYVEAQTGADG